MSSPRHEVNVFAQAMEHKLRLNDHKGGWEEQGLDYLLMRLRAEIDELEKAIEDGNFFDITLEAADVANFAMMVAWNATRREYIGDENGPDPEDT